MSKKTGSQMEAVLLDRIETAKIKLEIGTLAYKHGLHTFDLKQLDHVFAKVVGELNHDHA